MPYTQGAYSWDFDGDRWDIMEALKAPVDKRLFFAGEAMSFDNQATVPGAMQSGYEATRMLLETP